MFKHSIVGLALLVLNVYLVNACHTFQNVSVKVVPRKGDPFNQTVNGCIERTSFGGGETQVAEIYAKNQRIPTLHRDSIRHLVRLKVLSFFGTYTETLQPEIFRNLPRLWALAIIYSHIKTVPKGAFNNLPSLETLRIHNNEIDLIEDEAFGNLESLKKIYVSNNKLVNWNLNWFNNTIQLTEMDFEYNFIREIPKDAFKNLRNLSRIYFDHNDITKIQSGAFRGIQNLNYLGLRYNKLTTLDANIFPNELRINTLLIDSNKLNYLPNEVLNKVSVKHLTIDGNPWMCPCLDRINFWIFQNNGSMRSSPYCQGANIPVCVYPETYSETCLEVVDYEVTQTYLEKVREATKDSKDFNLAQCVRYDDDNK